MKKKLLVAPIFMVVILAISMYLVACQTPVVGSTMISEKDGMTLLYVPTGKFIMGNSAEDALKVCQKHRSDCKLDWFKEEDPPHEIYLDAFWIDQTEVTNKMYAKCVVAGDCIVKDIRSMSHSFYYSNPEFDDYPVIGVDWIMAKTYCEWAGRRLPTEAEWEKAASWDDETKTKRVYPWGDVLDCSFANYGKDSFSSACVGDLTAVKSYESGKSFYGAYDMAGNVWEWVNDRYSDTYYLTSPLSNPLGPDTGSLRVLRGGSYLINTEDIRSTSRNWGDLGSFNLESGFRCSRSP